MLITLYYQDNEGEKLGGIKKYRTLRFAGVR